MYTQVSDGFWEQNHTSGRLLFSLSWVLKPAQKCSLLRIHLKIFFYCDVRFPVLSITHESVFLSTAVLMVHSYTVYWWFVSPSYIYKGFAPKKLVSVLLSIGISNPSYFILRKCSLWKLATSWLSRAGPETPQHQNHHCVHTVVNKEPGPPASGCALAQ